MGHRPCRPTNHPNIINPCRPITSHPSSNSNVILRPIVTATIVVPDNINRPTHHRPCPPTTHPNSNISVILLRTVQAPDVVHDNNSVVMKNVSSPAVVTTVARVAKVAKEDTTVVASVVDTTVASVAREAKVVKVVVISNP